MVDKKITELDAFTVPVDVDLFVMVDDISGTATTKKITFANVESNLDHDALTNYVGNEHIDWTADSAGTIHSSNYTNTTYTGGTNLTLDGTTFNVDDAFIKNDADDTSTHKITAANFAVTADNNTNDSEYVPMVLHGTDETPPTASGFPQGTIYIQYTA